MNRVKPRAMGVFGSLLKRPQSDEDFIMIYKVDDPEYWQHL
jgi:hypothetical protein